MTEVEWLAYADPTPMLEFLRGQVSERKLRLFAVGCCRRIGNKMQDGRSLTAVDVAEQFADGLVTSADRHAAFENARAAVNELGIWYLTAVEKTALATAEQASRAAAEALANAAEAAWVAVAANDSDPFFDFDLDGPSHVARMARAASLRPLEPVAHCNLLRDIVGNPSHCANLAPAWISATVLSLAQAIYNDRAFDRLPILADALEEAGCTDRDILDHCRQPGVHVRGCWVVDLVLGKE